MAVKSPASLASKLPFFLSLGNAKHSPEKLEPPLFLFCFVLFCLFVFILVSLIYNYMRNYVY